MREILVEQPEGLRSVKDPKGNEPWLEKLPLLGPWVRCIPECMLDIVWLAGLSHQHEKYAPAIGEGILVRLDVMERR